MSKIKIKSLLKNISENEIHNIETTGIKIDNKIKYTDDNTNVFIEIKNDEIILTRINKDSELKLIFNNALTTSGIYDIKIVSRKLNISIKTTELVITNNLIIIEYIMSLENEEYKNYKFELEYEVL